jgi:penicillin G amidase
MKLLRRILLFAALLLLLLAAIGAFVVNDWTRGVLPQHSGEVRVSGLRDRVEILRDADGVPHIYASNLHDLYFAQGYTQAQDRWWQMEFYRHVASGRIQELTGQSDALFGTDVFIRTIGWRVSAERDLAVLTDETRAMLQSFTDGINAYIGGKSAGDLAFEYNVLGVTGVTFTVDMWTMVDTLAFSRVMSWDLADNRSEEFFMQALIEAVGPEMASAYAVPYPYEEHPPIINADELTNTSASARLPVANTTQVSAVQRSVAYAGDVPQDATFIFGEVGGSNSWVANGNMTESGAAMLANDPHLGIGMPSIWYEVGLHCAPISADCGMNVVGFTFATVPGIVVGHNGRIAWGLTTLPMDVQDNYLLRINPENPMQYQWDDDWRDFTTRSEEIRFGDGGSITVTVRDTHFGPVTNDNGLAYRCGDQTELVEVADATAQQQDTCTLTTKGFNNETPIALRWSSWEPSRLMDSIRTINVAQDWQTFRAALSLWDTAAQNFVYADADGNIGYQATGRAPIRATGQSGGLPTEGWRSDTEWLGYVPFDLMPTLYNPARNYIVTANNAPVPLAYFETLATQQAGNVVWGSSTWDEGYRADRITDLMIELAPHTAETFAQIHGDNAVPAMLRLTEAARPLTFADAALTDARDWLLEWDGRFDADSGRAALFAYYWQRVAHLTLSDQMPEGYKDIQATETDLQPILALLDTPDDAWWDDAATADVVEQRDDILARAFAEGYAALVAAQGPDRAAWRWGRAHISHFVSNPLGLSGIDLIENMVNRSGYETNGCKMCVNATGWEFSPTNGFAVDWLPSFRFIIDFADVNAAQSILTTGQSGHSASDTYSNQIERWRTTQYHPLRWERAQVEAASVQTLVLVSGS